MKVELIHSVGTDDTVVDAARVSFSKQADNYTKEQNDKLIKYLAEHKHFSPFGHCFATFRIEAPIFVRSQLVKHEYLRMNEVSRRYVDTPPKFYKPKEWRKKADDKKQGSSSSETVKSSSTMAIDNHYLECSSLYTQLLIDGVCPEQARMVLPQSMMTEWFWSGSMDAFANMRNLRCKPDAQAETRFIAEQIDKWLASEWPASWRALCTT